MFDILTFAKEARAVARVATRMPRFLPGSPWSLSRHLTECARRWPNDTAVMFEDRRYTWREVDGMVNRTAHALGEMGVSSGDSVALLMDNRPEYLFAVTALSRLRARGALINTNITGDALTHALRAGQAAFVVVGAEHEAKLEAVRDELPCPVECVRSQRDGEEEGSGRFDSFDALIDRASEREPDGIEWPRGEDAAYYIYTSGTTGLPKAAVVSNSRILMAGAMLGLGMIELRPSDVIYVTLPLYHSNGMFAGWSGALQSGAAIALRRKFSASNFWADVRRYEATAFVYIGELCRYLLNAPPHPKDGQHRLRVACGNGLRPDIWDEFQDRFKVPLIREFYGATEGVGAVANIAGKRGMVGRLQPGQAIARCDPLTGELWRGSDGLGEPLGPGSTGLFISKIGGAFKFDGYVDKAASEKKILHDVFEAGDAWFNSGDLLDLHDGRWLSFADRVGDTFRWKGENVSTNEVAAILNGAPGVRETNVYGVEVPGADGKAGMASVNCGDEFDLDAFNRWVIEKLPVFQRPYFVRLQHEMRITGTFKHQKTDYVKEGYDPERVADPLFFLDGDKYVPLDAEIHRGIRDGSVAVR